MRILVAEDQPELRRMLVKNLTAAGYTVDGVPDGEEALAYLDAADYDVAVLDIMMPKVDGLTVLRTLRGRTLELSAREYALLEYLMRNKGVILSRQQIENNLWSLDYAGGTNVVDVYISYLRKKLELPGEARLLHTVRGMGWVLKEDA